MLIEERLTWPVRAVLSGGGGRLGHFLPNQKQVISDSEPVPCSLTPQNPGTHRITAVIKDTKGRDHETQMVQWVVGKGQVVWDERPDNRLEIIPEKNRYAAGDRARYLIKNPFPGAKALVTVERYGVLRHWVQELQGSTPMIEFYVKQDETLGFYLSVVASPQGWRSRRFKPVRWTWANPAFAWVM